MSSKTQHEEQARHNETLRSSVLDTHPDWELTVALCTICVPSSRV